MLKSTHIEVSSLRLRVETSEFWSGDVGLTLITVSLTIFTFLILPLAEGGLLGRFVLDVVLATLMVSGALRIGSKRVTTTLAIVVLLAALIVLWVSLMHSTPFLQRLSSTLAIIAFLLYFRIVLLVMFRQGPVTWSRIQGGVSAYLLLGLAWSRAYQLTEQIHAGSFRFVSRPANVEQLSAKLSYFSFGTLTTVGFGDVLAVYPFARSLAIAEALVGQLFPAILIGALVAMALQSRPEIVMKAGAATKSSSKVEISHSTRDS